VAVVVHWPNHPEASGGGHRYISGDFVTNLTATLEEATPGATGIYWQGPIGGLMNPLHVDVIAEDGTVLSDDSFEKADRLGELVAEEALAALEGGEDVTGDGRLAFRVRQFLVPFENQELEFAWLAGMFERTVFDEKGRPYDPTTITPDIEPHIQTEVTVIDLGEVQIATVPGELYPELAIEGPGGEVYYQDPQDPGADFPGEPCAPVVQAVMRDTPFRIVLGLANDEVGYIVPKCQWDRTPPYAYGRDRPQYGEGLSIGPEMAPTLNRILAEELEALATD
jgi:hypothetical protein